MNIKPKDHGALQPICRKEIDSWVSSGRKPGSYEYLLQLLADLVDYAIEHGDTWCTLGITRNQDAIMLTLNQDGYKGYVTGATFKDLSVGCKDLL